MLVGDKLGYFYQYAKQKLGRPIFTHDLANADVIEKLRSAAFEDFLTLCSDDEHDNETSSRILNVAELEDVVSGKPVWLEMRTCSWPEDANITGWVFFKCFTSRETLNGECGYHFANLYKQTPMPLKESDYGLEWRCWTDEPTKTQMDLEKWDG